METFESIFDPEKLGKDAASHFLCRRCYAIIATETYDDSGCIDIVASKDGTVVFVRVTCGAEEEDGPDPEERARAALEFLARPIRPYVLGFTFRDVYDCDTLRFDDIDVSLIEHPLMPSKSMVRVLHSIDVVN